MRIRNGSADVPDWVGLLGGVPWGMHQWQEMRNRAPERHVPNYYQRPSFPTCVTTRMTHTFPGAAPGLHTRFDPYCGKTQSIFWLKPA